jgi:hypothetical protein
MKTDREVQRMVRERHQGKSLDQAAARAGMSVPTARKYLRAGKLPSQLKAPHLSTATDPFCRRSQWRAWCMLGTSCVGVDERGGAAAMQEQIVDGAREKLATILYEELVGKPVSELPFGRASPSLTTAHERCELGGHTG